MTPEQDKLLRDLIVNPPPGSDLEAAKKYGVDLTLLYENLKLTPTERARKLEAGARAKTALRQAGQLHRAAR